MIQLNMRILHSPAAYSPYMEGHRSGLQARVIFVWLKTLFQPTDYNTFQSRLLFIPLLCIRRHFSLKKHQIEPSFYMMSDVHSVNIYWIYNKHFRYATSYIP